MLVHSPVTHARSARRSLSLSLSRSVRESGRGTDGVGVRYFLAPAVAPLLSFFLSAFLPSSVAPSGLLCVPLTELTLLLVVHSHLPLSLLRRTESHH